MSEVTRPSALWAAVSPSDSTSLMIGPAANTRPRGLYIGVSGSVVVQGDDGVSITFTAVPVGVLPVSPIKVMAATTATNIVALY